MFCMCAVNEKYCIDKHLDKISNFNLCLLNIIMHKVVENFYH